ncbi:MAG: RNA methyltransferase [Rhodospirillaceae bacterium]|nr:RNA methyltransferase [Rhodospirillaceae bacterium]
MSGTDSSKPLRIGSGPVVILVEPQLGENIGAAARAMLNCGLGELRLVRPRDGWPNPKARAAASGADAVIDAATVHADLPAAIGDLNRVYASTARPRQMIKPVVTPRQAAAELRQFIAAGERVGVLFGPERSGLDNDALALADTLVTVPLNPAFASLNLAQAVLIIGYEWFQAGDATPPRQLVTNQTRPATKEELLGFFQHLERECDLSGFLRNAEKRPSMVRNIRNIFQRAALTHQEVQTLHGIVKDLANKRERGRHGAGPAE